MMKLLTLIMSLLLFVQITTGQIIKPKKLMKLVRNGEIEKIKSLIEKDSSLINIKNKLNGNLLTTALWNGQTEIAKYLIEKNININVQETRIAKYTPLLISISQRQYEITHLLVKKGADLNTEAKHGATPIRTSMQLSSPENEKDIEIFKFLIESGADFQCICGNCCQANYLMFALNHHKSKMAKYLIEKGINIHHKDCNGYTALHRAVNQGNLELTKTLIEKGANPKEKDNTGKTAFDLAKRNNNEEIVDFLKDYN